MSDRRDILAALACFGSLAVAEALRPRRALSLVPAGTTLPDLIPTTVGRWHAEMGGDIVVPRTTGALSTKLYTEQLARLYHEDRVQGPDVMLMIAYGKAQSDSLQLHRPEVCYPAIGFEVLDRRFLTLEAQPGRNVPAVSLTARSGDRIEDIVYWTRVGSYLPTTASEQRSDRLKAAFSGYVGDGMLVRASALRPASAPVHARVADFLEALLTNVSPLSRRALIGPGLSNDRF